MNNSDDSIPMVSSGSQGVWTLPKELVWDMGHRSDIILHFPYNAPYRVYHAQCKALLDNEPLMDSLRATKFDAAIVDLGKHGEIINRQQYIYCNKSIYKLHQFQYSTSAASHLPTTWECQPLVFGHHHLAD